MNVNDYQFKPKLSRHEMILDKYKNILNSTSKSSTNDHKSNSNSYDHVLSSNTIRSYVSNNFSDNRSENVFQNNSNRDQIETLKAKYLNPNQNRDLSYQNNDNYYMSSMNKQSIQRELINSTKANFEIELLKSKYCKINKSLENPKFQDLTYIEEKLNNYRPVNVDSNLSLESNIENGQSNINTENELLNKINQLEERLNKLQNTKIEKQEIMEKVKEIVDKIEPEQENKIHSEIPRINLEKIKSLKDQNLTKLNEHKKEDTTTSVVLNQIIHNVTGRLFESNPTQKHENNHQSKNLDKTSLKSRSKTPKKKIRSFEEFIESGLN